jgi:hypothetical protein
MPPPYNGESHIGTINYNLNISQKAKAPKGGEKTSFGGKTTIFMLPG